MWSNVVGGTFILCEVQKREYQDNDRLVESMRDRLVRDTMKSGKANEFSEDQLKEWFIITVDEHSTVALDVRKQAAQWFAWKTGLRPNIVRHMWRTWCDGYVTGQIDAHD